MNRPLRRTLLRTFAVASMITPQRLLKALLVYAYLYFIYLASPLHPLAYLGVAGVVIWIMAIGY